MIEPLEVRALLTATLYVDFGDRFSGATGLTDAGSPVTQARFLGAVNGPQFSDNAGNDVGGATGLSFTSFAAEAAAAGLDAAQTAALRDNIMTLMYRYYDPFDVNIVELNADPGSSRGAATLADIAATLGRRNTKDAYVLVAGVTDAAGTLTFSTTSHGASGGNDMLNGGNSTDDTAVVLANNLFADGSADAVRGDTAFAYTTAHESSHTFGLEHAANGDLNDDTRLTTSDIISQFYNSAADLDAAADQLANFNMFTRFPLQKGNGAAAGDTYVPFDRLARTVGTPKYGPAYVTGTGAHDRITIAKAGRNQATVNVEAFRNPDFTEQIASTYTYTLRNIANGIIVTAGWGDDLVIIDSRLGEDLEILGMAGDDKIQVLGLGKAGTATYKPWGMSEIGRDEIESFGGNISASSGGPTRTTIMFRELEPNGWVRFDHFESVTLTTPNATDRLGATVPEAGVTEVFGSSTDTLPLQPIVPLRVNMVRTLVLNTASRDGIGDSPDDEIRFAADVMQETRIRSGAGNDTIITAGGDDVIEAGDGDDFVDAGAGNDRVLGGRGNDTLIGGEGDDRLLGGDGNDTLESGPGNDILWGGLGDDSLQGGDGNDILVGDSGNDRLTAGSGRDLLIGGRDVDTLFGESDDDILIGGATGYDTNSDALLTILAEWTSNRTIDERIDSLTRGVGRNNSIRLKRGATVFTDRAQNELWGGSDADWFITMGNDLARDFAPEVDRT